MGNWNTGGGGGGSAGDFDDSYNDAMGYDAGFDDGDTGYDGGDASGDPSEESTVDFSGGGGDTGSFLDDDNDGIPNYLDKDTAGPVDYGYDYPAPKATPTVDYDYAAPAPKAKKAGQPTSFGDLYNPFETGDYNLPTPGDSDGDGIPDTIDTDSGPYTNAYNAFRALPDYTFQKQLVNNPEQALKNFNAKPKKIDTLDDGTEIYEVLYNQKSPISGEVLERGFVYTIGPDGQKVNNLYNITDENSLSDGFANVLGTVIPLAVGVPVRASIDTKMLNEYALNPKPFHEYEVEDQYFSTSGLSAFGKDLGRTTVIETIAERESRIAREEAERQAQADSGGDNQVVRLATAATAKDLEEKYEAPNDYEKYFAKFTDPSSTYVSPYDVLRGRATAAVGGEINAEDDDYLTVNAEYVKQMPDAFMRDPAMARSPEEVKAIFAHNRRVQAMVNGPKTMNQGGVAVTGESGPIIENPENVTEAESVADNVEKTVPEGTFIINQPAAELMGTKDVKEMLLSAVKELRKQGVDFSFGEDKIREEDAVSLLVSKGEIMVHPLLAKVIGIDRLNKINNRGRAEVEKRIKENGQSPQAEQAQAVV